ncbi:hypothetical protein ZWY2020_033857 [Hordeum vulgare]|nr:hypothetical protein ZWY2020_033857 [Hordeum vulgare]
MDKNLGKISTEDGAEDPQQRRKYYFPSKSRPKRPCDDGDGDADVDSDGEADVVPKRKKTSKSKGTIDDDEGDDARFNRTVLLSLPTMCKVDALLKEAHYNHVQDAGLGTVFELTVKQNVSHILMCYLMCVIDPATITMDFGNDRVLQINRAAVHHIFGFPMGPHTAPMPATSGHDDSLCSLTDELGFRRSQGIGVKDLVQKLAEFVEDDDQVTVDLAVKVFFLILYQNLLCPGITVCLGRVAAMVENMDYAAMVQMDFCQLVIDELQLAVVKWQTDGSK